jgi:ABC-type transport system involved in multi-copper enzyme maturation permease subunit
MSAIPGIVAIHTFREAVRDRVLYNLIVFALMMIGASILVGEISIGIDRLVIINLGLSAISIFGLVMAIFIGVGLVYKEMEKRTLYSLLAKPVRRWEFLVGKFGGLLLTLVVNTWFMTLGLAVALFYVSGQFLRADVTILVAIYFILLELALVTAFALFFSCFSSPMLSTLFTLGFMWRVFSQATFARLAWSREALRCRPPPVSSAICCQISAIST